MPVKRKRLRKQEARGRLSVSPGGFASWGGARVVSHRVRTQAAALQLLQRGDISQENYDEVAHLLPRGLDGNCDDSDS